MSEEENETIIPPPIEELMDPLEILVRDWVQTEVQDALGEEYEGLNMTFDDLGSLILGCFDTVQEVMLAAVVPEGTTIH